MFYAPPIRLKDTEGCRREPQVTNTLRSYTSHSLFPLSLSLCPMPSVSLSARLSRCTSMMKCRKPALNVHSPESVRYEQNRSSENTHHLSSARWVAAAAVAGGWFRGAARPDADTERAAGRRRHSVTDLGDGAVADPCAPVRKSSRRTA